VHKTDLLVVVRYPEADMAELERHYTLHVLSDTTDHAALLANVEPLIRAVATNGEAGAGAELIYALPQLEIIVSYGVGVDAIDLAQSRGMIAWFVTVNGEKRRSHWQHECSASGSAYSVSAV
jgi:lactate dehydrogenase-like 2-hydroxyacid dehydrogenase